MPDLYPKIEPYDRGLLDVGEGHRLYWEVCGNPQGKPAVVLHGGPGSGCTPDMRRFFDPERYRVVLFDQRNAGRSTPHAGDFSTDLSTNTTDRLVADIEKLRAHLKIERWLVLGGSWGVTLGVAYALAHLKRVTQMVLFSIATSQRSEIHWLYHEAGRLFPEEWSRFRAGAAGANLVEAYHRLLNDPDPAMRERAAKDWCDWEDAVVSAAPNRRPSARYADPAFRMAFARIVTHYFRNGAFLEDGVLLRDASLLKDISAVLIHGRLDIGSPLATAWALSQAWPGSELIVVHEAGHELRTPGMRESIVAALDRFARAQ